MAKRRDKRPKKPPLFNRPMTELREAFVHARFAEEHCFGRADIETWLAREREAERPEYDPATYASPWNAVLLSDHMSFAALGKERERLTTLATPLTETPAWLLVSDRARTQRAEVEHLLAMIDRTRVDTYYGYGEGHVLPILVTKSSDSDHAVALDCDAVAGVAIQPLHSQHVVDAIFAEWMYGGPRWREARQFICGALAKDVHQERRMAEYDFDEAVAVSADGTRIVRADRVFTFDPRDPIGLAYVNVTATEFHVRGVKVLLMPELKRNERMHGDGAVFDHAGILADLLQQCMTGRQHRQVLATSLTGNTFLITHPDFMPELEDLDAPPWSDEA